MYRKEVIFIRIDLLQSPLARSVIRHEAVHHLQYERDGEQMDDYTHLNREIEAYAVQFLSHRSNPYEDPD